MSILIFGLQYTLAFQYVLAFQWDLFPINGYETGLDVVLICSYRGLSSWLGARDQILGCIAPSF